MTTGVKNSIKSVSLKLFVFFIRTLDLIVPKNEHLIVCGAPYAAGNSYYFLQYVTEEHYLGYRAVWLSRNENDVKQIRAKFGPDSAFKITSIKGIYFYLRAKVVEFSHGASDLFYLIGNWNPRKYVVNFWHGIPIKRMDGLKYNTKCRWDLMIASSDIEKRIYEEISEIRSDIIISGYPRNEYLAKNVSNSELVEKLKKPILKKINFIPDEIITYMPTYRSHEKTQLFPFQDFESNILIEFLRANNILIILRLHPNEKSSLTDKKYANLINSGYVISGNMSEIKRTSDLLLISDLVITDYSSVYYDFLTLKRPTIFIPYDKPEYETLYGFSLDYNKRSSQLTALDFQSFLQLIRKINSKDEKIDDKIKSEYKQFHQYESENCTETIINEIHKRESSKKFWDKPWK